MVGWVFCPMASVHEKSSETGSDGDCRKMLWGLNAHKDANIVCTFDLDSFMAGEGPS